MEEIIMQTEDDPRQKLTKRAKLDTSVVAVDTAKWIELARFVCATQTLLWQLA